MDRRRPPVRASLPCVLLLACAALAAAQPGTALAAAHRTTPSAAHHKAASKPPAFHQDTTPLPASVSGRAGTRTSTPSVGSTSGDVVRTVVGLAVVLAVVYGLYWLLKSGAKARAGSGDERIAVVATTPLGPNRNLHLVRSGGELILIGAAEQSITTLRVYSAEQAAHIELEQRVAAQPGGGGAARAGFLDTLRRMTER